jgi:SH3-like domain-containing protein
VRRLIKRLTNTFPVNCAATFFRNRKAIMRDPEFPFICATGSRLVAFVLKTRTLAGKFTLVLSGLAVSAFYSHAAEFRSIGAQGAISYDAPSNKAKKLFILGPEYPVEIIVALGDWSKVRDATGVIAWVENKALTSKRTLIVKAPLVPILEAPQESSSLVTKAQEGVVLEWVDAAPPPWIKVKHRDGEIGFVTSNQVWGN